MWACRHVGMRACFMLARVGTPSALIREREGEREREREGGRERKREGGSEREEERERCRIWLLNLNERTGALAPFSYLV